MRLNAMLKLMDPLEAGGLVVSRMVGSIRIYALAQAPWTEPVKALVNAVAQRPDLASAVAAARVLMRVGGHSSRKHLRNRLGMTEA